MKGGKKITVVMPAYNAEKTLEKTYKDIPKGCIDEAILVDDVSRDATVKVAKKLGLTVIRHERNKGYGGNQKTCYTEALKRGADVVVLLHPDYQFDPKAIPALIKPILDGKADVAYGSRMMAKGSAKKGGMPLYKRIGNRMLTAYFNIMLGTKLTDAATGLIAYSRKALETIPYQKNSNGFTFDEEAIIQCRYFRFRMAEIPIITRYEKESSTISLKKSIKYGMTLFWRIIMYKLHKWGIRKFYLLERNP
ncbi:glycosyltransferase family 2 protein [Candidatus Woesearchaeota archaeon]|nr:glycosyltransferase family 2 protein [Candidatus Woesearchaeota archaeon]